jgi:hypothetical protein
LLAWWTAVAAGEERPTNRNRKGHFVHPESQSFCPSRPHARKPATGILAKRPFYLGGHFVGEKGAARGFVVRLQKCPKKSKSSINAGVILSGAFWCTLGDTLA